MRNLTFARVAGQLAELAVGLGWTPPGWRAPGQRSRWSRVLDACDEAARDADLQQARTAEPAALPRHDA